VTLKRPSTWFDLL